MCALRIRTQASGPQLPVGKQRDSEPSFWDRTVCSLSPHCCGQFPLGAGQCPLGRRDCPPESRSGQRGSCLSFHFLAPRPPATASRVWPGWPAWAASLCGPPRLWYSCKEAAQGALLGTRVRPAAVGQRGHGDRGSWASLAARLQGTVKESHVCLLLAVLQWSQKREPRKGQPLRFRL